MTDRPTDAQLAEMTRLAKECVPTAWQRPDRSWTAVTPPTPAAVLGLIEEIKAGREALEYIAEEHDAGRHDGLPEPCPAHDAMDMWLRARAHLAAPSGPRGGEEGRS